MAKFYVNSQRINLTEGGTPTIVFQAEPGAKILDAEVTGDSMLVVSFQATPCPPDQLVPYSFLIVPSGTVLDDRYAGKWVATVVAQGPNGTSYYHVIDAR